MLLKLWKATEAFLVHFGTFWKKNREQLKHCYQVGNWGNKVLYPFLGDCFCFECIFVDRVTTAEQNLKPTNQFNLGFCESKCALFFPFWTLLLLGQIKQTRNWSIICKLKRKVEKTKSLQKQTFLKEFCLRSVKNPPKRFVGKSCHFVFKVSHSVIFAHLTLSQKFQFTQNLKVRNL